MKASHNNPVNNASKLAGTSMALLVLRFHATLAQNNQYHSGPLPGRYVNMNRLPIFLLIYFLASCSTIKIERQVIVGEITKGLVGHGIVRDCATGKEYTLGVMASNQYSMFSKKYEKLKISGAVKVKLTGFISGNKATIVSPVIESLTNGACN